MKTTRKTVARLLPLLALLALGPLSCTDAGDEPGGPTGPSTVYNPEMDYPGASIVAEASDSNLQAGETFTVVVTYADANGAVVTDAPLAIASEVPYFSTPANPSYTNGEGRASFQVSIDSDCPSGSYYFAVYTGPATPLNGSSTLGSFSIRVTGVAAAATTITTPGTPTGDPAPSLATTPTSTYLTAGASCSDGDTVQYRFATTGGTAATFDWSTNPFKEITWTTEGPWNVSVQARCQNSPTVTATSGSLSVTVGP